MVSGRDSSQINIPTDAAKQRAVALDHPLLRKGRNFPEIKKVMVPPSLPPTSTGYIAQSWRLSVVDSDANEPGAKRIRCEAGRASVLDLPLHSLAKIIHPLPTGFRSIVGRDSRSDSPHARRSLDLHSAQAGARPPARASLRTELSGQSQTGLRFSWPSHCHGCFSSLPPNRPV